MSLLADSGDHSDVPTLADQLWTRVRADRDAEADLSRPEMVAPTLVLTVVVQKLVAAGDLLATLRARREDLDVQIARLELLRARESHVS